MIQLINKQTLTFRVENTEFDYVKPKYIMLKSEFMLRTAVLKGSTMFWNIKGKQVSYNQLKELLGK
jgi:hypothetical protein